MFYQYIKCPDTIIHTQMKKTSLNLRMIHKVMPTNVMVRPSSLRHWSIKVKARLLKNNT